MSIQQAIDDELTNADPEDGPCGDISVSGEDGSFKMPKGLRLYCEKGGDATCSSAEGMNELTMLSYDNVKVTDFTDGIIRLEDCKQADIKTSGKVTIHVSNCDQLKLDIQGTNLTFSNCKVMTLKTQDCEIWSYNNQYQGDTQFQGGRLDSLGDQFETVSFKNLQLWVQKPTQGQDVTFDECAGAITQCQFDKLTVKGSKLQDYKGQYSDKCDIQDSTYSSRECEYQGDLSLKSGRYDLSEATLNGALDAQEAALSADALQVQGKVTVSGKSAAFGAPKFQDDVTVENCQVRISGGQLQGKFEASSSSLDSDNNQYQDDFTLTGGNLQSKLDTFSGNLEGTGLKGPNMIHAPQGSPQQLTLTGATNPTLRVSDVECQQGTVTGFGKVYMESCQVQDMTLSGFGLAVLNAGEFQQLTANQGGTLTANTSQISQGTIENVSMAQTAGASELTVTSCVMVDAGSSFVGLTGCTLFGTGSQVAGATGSVIFGVTCDVEMEASFAVCVGGTCTATGLSVVIPIGCDVTNDDGLTMGTGFDPAQNFLSLFAGGTGILSCLANLVANSVAGDVSVTSEVGAVTATAATAFSASAPAVSITGEATIIGGSTTLTMSGAIITEN